ncbi:hypothetical protein B0H12DRAFT_165490 [Mycena haematopus]|nr:hypothetical protein B0H12DRAFT_165490 [Mycena haematopus]
MHSFESEGCKFHNLAHVTQEDWDHSHQVLLQASPSLAWIFQAVTLIRDPVIHSVPQSLLFGVHLLLDVPWNELRITICSLCSFMDDRRLLATLFVVAPQSNLIPAHLDAIVLNLTCGALRVLQQILHDELPRSIMLGPVSATLSTVRGAVAGCLQSKTPLGRSLPSVGSLQRSTVAQDIS